MICSLGSISRFTRAWVWVCFLFCYSVCLHRIQHYCRAEHYTRSHALCVICVKHLAQAQHFKNKKSSSERARERECLFLCVLFTPFYEDFLFVLLLFPFSLCLPVFACDCVQELPLQILNECKFFIPLGVYRWCKQQKITHKHIHHGRT